MRTEISTDGSIWIGQQHVRIPNIVVTDTIGQGANGVVFLGKNEFLSRSVAVKLWVKLKPRDTRDKFKQGFEEAKKASDSEQVGVVRILDAGESGGLFYCVMEFFDGVPLKDWLATHPCFYERITLAEALYVPINNLTCKSIHHGDLHWGNVLVANKGDFRIVDFGTSFFVGRQDFLFRHWKVLYKMIQKLVWPLDPFKLYESEYPLSFYVKSGIALDIFGSFIKRWHALVHYAISYSGRQVWLSEITKKHINNTELRAKEKTVVENLVDSRKLEITNEFLGRYSPWGKKNDILPII